MIVTLIIHWLGPPLFLLWCSKPAVAIWSQGLAIGLNQKNTHEIQIWVVYQLSYPGPLFIICWTVDLRKDSAVLGSSWDKGIPIEVLPMAYRSVQTKIESQLGGKAVLRMAKNKAVSVIIYSSGY